MTHEGTISLPDLLLEIEFIHRSCAEARMTGKLVCQEGEVIPMLFPEYMSPEITFPDHRIVALAKPDPGIIRDVFKEQIGIG